MIGKKKIHIMVMICLLVCMGMGGSALAVCIPFDINTRLQPIRITSEDNGIQPYGTYIASGTSEIQNLGSGTVRIGASTSCYRTCASVTADAYLESKEGGSWWTVTYKLGTGYNTYYVSTYKDVAVARGQYYRVRGAHSTSANGVTETTGSVTGSMYID